MVYGKVYSFLYLTAEYKEIWPYPLRKKKIHKRMKNISFRRKIVTFNGFGTVIRKKKRKKVSFENR